MQQLSKCLLIPSPETSWPSIIQRLHAARPEIEAQLSEVPTPDLARLAQAQIDLVIDHLPRIRFVSFGSELFQYDLQRARLRRLGLESVAKLSASSTEALLGFVAADCVNALECLATARVHFTPS